MRHYTYKDQVLLTSGRLYQGQTTNFRTVNGDVVVVSDSDCYELDFNSCNNPHGN